MILHSKVFSTFFLLIFSMVTAFSADKPNIVFILADDLGYGDLKANNPECKNAAPAIDSIASEGMVFTDMHSGASWCVPSRYALLTSTYPFKNTNNWKKMGVIGKDEMTLPKMLKANGYSTAMIGKWHLGFDTGMDFHADKLTGGPFDRGFDYFYGLPHSLDIQPYLYIENDKAVQKPTGKVGDRGPTDPNWTKIQGEFWRKGECAPNFKHDEVLDVLADRSAQKIKDHAKNSDKPLFLYVPLTAPHTPWLPGERFMKNSPNGLYGAFVAHVDDCVKRIDDAITEAGIKDNTIIIITSDNGPVWYDKDEERTGHKSNGILRGMKADAWEGGHRVPFIVRWPKGIKAGVRYDGLASFLDVLPTMADVVGDESHSNKYNDGLSLGKAFNDSQRSELVHLDKVSHLAIRYKDWKYIPFLGSGGFSKPKYIKAEKGGPTGQLYNLAKDPGEQKNLFSEYPELVKELHGKIEKAKK
ncbi:MAG: arylsulfatase [Lentisphaeraceae bacterium]|nr:arylsulfatase [Lentisphaeraceae bacterium]